MTVVIVSPHFPPTFAGGVETYARNHATWLARRGHQVHVVAVERVTTDSSLAVETTDADGITIHRLAIGFGAGQSLNVVWDHPHLASWFASLLQAVRPDVMHVHSGYLIGAPALAAARAANVRTLLTLHDFWFICPRLTLLQPDGTRCTGPDEAAKCAWCLTTEQRRYQWADRLTAGAAGTLGRAIIHRSLARRALAVSLAERLTNLRHMLNRVDVVLSPSHFLARMISGAGEGADNLRVQATGIELVRRHTTARRETGLRIGYVGRIVREKGIHVLVEAAAHLPFPDWILTIHGPDGVDPRYTSRLRRMTGRDARYRFAGPFENVRLGTILGDLDVLVVPSIWYENRPLVILEAQQAGVPVIASRLGGMAELIDHGRTGLLFEPDDARDLARQLTHLHTDASLRARLSEPMSTVTVDEEMEQMLAAYAGTAR